jgi:hypothetical protein
MQRPADLISYPQQCAITATGLIWSRFSTQITPVRGGRGEGVGSRDGAVAASWSPSSREPPLHAAALSSALPSPLPSPAQVNYNLLAVNCFMAVTGIYQLQRKIRHNMDKSKAAGAEVAAA